MSLLLYSSSSDMSTLAQHEVNVVHAVRAMYIHTQHSDCCCGPRQLLCVFSLFMDK